MVHVSPAFQFRVLTSESRSFYSYYFLFKIFKNIILDFLKPLSYYYDIPTMGTSKKEAFSNSQNRLADLAKAFAHPARIAILEFLAKKNACICGDIVEELPLSQATVSQHLAELKRIGLIIGEIEGPKMCYCINKKAWLEAKQLLGQFMTDAKSCC
jgi:ArsR family transcriptional regulator